MNKLTTKLIAAMMLISTAVSSLATECTAPTPVLLLSANPAPLIAPTVLTQKATLNPAELVKYHQLAVQSRGLTSQQAAGASSTTKKVLIVVGVGVVVVGVAALVAEASLMDVSPY